MFKPFLGMVFGCPVNYPLIQDPRAETKEPRVSTLLTPDAQLFLGSSQCLKGRQCGGKRTDYTGSRTGCKSLFHRQVVDFGQVLGNHSLTFLSPNV